MSVDTKITSPKQSQIGSNFKWLTLWEFLRIDSKWSEDVFFKIPRVCDRLMGLWPGDVIETKLQYFHIIFCLTVSSLAALTQWAYIYSHINDVNDILVVIIPSSSLSVTLIKTLILIRKRSKLRQIIAILYEEWFNNENAEKYKSINFRMSKWAQLFSLSLVTFPSAVVITSTLAPIIGIINQFATGQQIERRISFVSEFPFSIDKEPIFELAYLFMTAAAVLVILSITAADGKFLTMCMYITGQFQIIKLELKNMIENELGKFQSANALSFNKKENDILLASLSKLVAKHTATIDLCKYMVKTFVPIIMVHFITAACILCVSCIGFIYSDKSEGFVFIFHASTVLSQLLLYCFGGAAILESSTQISDAAYSFHWYKTDTRIRKIIRLIIMHSQYGNSVTVPFFEVSAPIFLSIIRTAGSYITLMKSFI